MGASIGFAAAQEARGALPLGQILKDDGPTDRPQLILGSPIGATVAAATIGSPRAPFPTTLAGTPVEDDLHAGVPGERLLDVLVQLAAIARHDEELPCDLALAVSAALGRPMLPGSVEESVQRFLRRLFQEAGH